MFSDPVSGNFFLKYLLNAPRSYTHKHVERHKNLYNIQNFSFCFCCRSMCCFSQTNAYINPFPYNKF